VIDSVELGLPRSRIARAQETIDSGAVTAQLERWVAVAQAAKSAE
jgi:anthranilate phosphoribosyltransferase